MKFFKQTIPNTCQIIAVQHILNHFNINKTFDQIKKDLPNHDFGDLLQEIGIYLDKEGIKTTLISNHDQNKSKLFQQKLNKYKSLENFQNRIPKPTDIKNSPIIINVNATKIRNQKGEPSPHYIVILKKKEQSTCTTAGTSHAKSNEPSIKSTTTA